MRRRQDIAQAIDGMMDSHVSPTSGAPRRQRFPRAAIDALARSGALGLTAPRNLGGGGQGLAEAAAVVEHTAASCASTAAVLQAHYTAATVLNAHGSRWLRERLAAGEHLATLALAEAGDGGPIASQVPPRLHGGVVDLHGCKTWVPAAGEADSYLWSSRSFAGGSSATLWAIPADAPGLLVPASPALFAPAGWDPAGLPGLAAAPVTADPVRVPAESMLGADGEGGALAHGVVARWFTVLGAAVALGLMRGAVADAVAAARAAGRGRSRTAADAAIGGMRVQEGFVRSLLEDALAADAADAAGAGTGTALLVLRAAAVEGALGATAAALDLCRGGPAGTAAEHRHHDARSAAALAPVPELTQRQLDGIVPRIHGSVPPPRSRPARPDRPGRYGRRDAVELLTE